MTSLAQKLPDKTQPGANISRTELAQTALEARRVVRRWLALSVGALLTAGVFSLGLIIGRTPPFSGWITDPQFFKRALVIHVDLALIVWFYAFIAGLFCLIPLKSWARRVAGGGAAFSALGVILMVLSAGIEHAEPVLANYVPVVDHPLFLLGLGSFGAGTIIALLSGLIGADYRDEAPQIMALPGAARSGLKATALLVVVAGATFLASWAATPSTLEPSAFYELVFWGGGHVLQVACEAAMMSVWIILLSSILGRHILSKRQGALLFGLLAAPHFFAPLLTLEGTQSALYHAGSTRLMQFGIFPAVTLFLIISIRALYLGFRRGDIDQKILLDPRFVGFGTSAGLAVLGFALGAMIRGSNTMIPAHYHAAIGAVTVAFMTVALMLLEPVGLRAPRGRWRSAARLQPVLFGVGQLVFAAGFALAGAHGMARKTYGAEQSIRGVADWAGLVTMGVGGLVAVVGGLLFLAILSAAMAPNLSKIIEKLRLKARPYMAD